ncbi:zinc finger CCHC domain-containing protein 4 isoform X2 [Zootermopsis nevadensis]|uniref:zinc finger CCHC domain-containing protein 4 isoform X2 n=1 Tax=Zootermopsis nevadensis TaxID=136037 RepID=UPI000B8E4184|nr:zinc finger CCHC domain-containing protein 4 isoform X2 [Zootermopsis nevadensis]
MEELTRVEVILNDMNGNPSCPHGPMLLFKRVVNGAERSFFACSACRDRKDCNFFLWADEKVTPNKKKTWDLERDRITPKINHVKLYKMFVKLLEKSPEQRAFCHTCSILLISNEIAKKHDEHDVTFGISEYLLTHPSELLKPLENAKKEAQYLFSSHATRTIVNIARCLGAMKVLCLGTPRVHELVCSEMSTEMDSLLLDIDYRFHQFNAPSHFCWFNSFNNYFFSQEEGAHVLAEFLQRDGGHGIVLVMDPPFGGRVEPLAKTVQEIMQLHRKLCPNIHTDMLVLWIFPYFMEPQVLASCPDFTMLDYKVDYDNHSLFASGPKGRKHGSPVRIFTNANPKDIPLPNEEGYRYCEICQRWISQENRHCTQCNECSSKDGRTYVHCNECMRCVKPSWKHCVTCNRCCLPSHVCGEFVPSQLCFNCGQPGHKKRDCPRFGFDAAFLIKKPDCTLQLNSMKMCKKRKHTQNKIDEDEKQIFTNMSSKKQKLQNVNSKKSRKNIKKRKKSKSGANTSRRPTLQL